MVNRVESGSRPASPQERIKSIIPSIPSDGSPKKFVPVVLDPYDLESETISHQLTPEQRYWFYVQNGIPAESIAPLETKALDNIQALIPSKLIAADTLNSTRKEVIGEIRETYDLAVKQSIVDYILLDPSEQERLQIPPFLERYVPRIARAPVPWHEEVGKSKEGMEQDLYVTNPMMLEVLKAFSPFESLRIVDLSVFTPNVLPMTMEDFQNTLKNQCAAFRAKILNE
jgi:dynein heavy chain